MSYVIHFHMSYVGGKLWNKIELNMAYAHPASSILCPTLCCHPDQTVPVFFAKGCHFNTHSLENERATG